MMCIGVSKSGSPAPRPMTSRPAALSSAALVVTAMVGDGLMRDRRWARKDMIVAASGSCVREISGRYRKSPPGPAQRRSRSCGSGMRPAGGINRQDTKAPRGFLGTPQARRPLVLLVSWWLILFGAVCAFARLAEAIRREGRDVDRRRRPGDEV